MFDSGRIKELFSRKDINYTYIISEIGINHNGCLSTAIDLIKASKDAGVDAVKFQKRNLESVYSSNVLNDSNSAEWNFEYLIPLLKEVELDNDDYLKIREVCDELELDLIVTPFDEISAEFLAELGVSAFKIASADMTNIPLLRKCNSYNKPLFISTGMWSNNDIKRCAEIFNNENFSFAFLLAQSTYPAPYETLNLDYLQTLKKLTDIVGYSGHERGTFIPVAAVAMGCKVIEKHITFDKTQKGPDHKASMLPEEWKEMVYSIRMLEKARGAYKQVNQAEIQNKEAFAKSAVATKDLKEGHILNENDIVFKSPGKGIFPHEISDFYGKVLKKSISKEHYIGKRDFEDILAISDWEEFKFSKMWGIKCRFHDYETYKVLNSPCAEFHCSQTDLEVPFETEQSSSQLIVHAPEIFDRRLVDICSTDKETVEDSLDILQKSIDKTIKIARFFPNYKPKIVMHLGGMSLHKNDNPNYPELIEIAIDNFKKLRFDPDTVDILPENLPPRPWYLGGEWFQYGFMKAEDMINFCNYFDIGMTYDICHADLYCYEFNKSLEDYTRSVMPVTKHIHISDASGNSGEGLQIGEGRINFDTVLAEVKDYNFSWVSEIWSGHLHNGAGLYKCMRILSSEYNREL